LDALAPATADTTLLLRVVVAHEKSPASSAGLVHVAADLSAVTGGVVTTYGDELLDSVEGPNGPGRTGAVVVTQVNTGGNINIDTLARTAPTVVNKQLVRIADMETEVPSSPARPGVVVSDLVEVTVSAAVMNVNTPLDSVRDKEVVGTGAYADTNLGVLDVTDTRALGLSESPADQVADVLMPHAGLINFVLAIGEGLIVTALTVSVTLDLSEAELFGSARAERMVDTDAVLTQRYSGVPDDADTIIRALSPADNEDGLLLRTGVEGAGAAALTILEEMKDVGTSMVAAQVDEDVLALIEHNLAQVPLAVIVKTALATEEGTHVPILPLCAVPGVDGDQLLDTVRVEVRVGTGVDDSTHPVVLDEVGASSLRLVAAACDDALLDLTVVGAAGDMSTAHVANGDISATYRGDNSRIADSSDRGTVVFAVTRNHAVNGTKDIVMDACGVDDGLGVAQSGQGSSSGEAIRRAHDTVFPQCGR